jgi:hypothetical protein
MNITILVKKRFELFHFFPLKFLKKTKNDDLPLYPGFIFPPVKNKNNLGGAESAKPRQVLVSFYSCLFSSSILL